MVEHVTAHDARRGRKTTPETLLDLHILMPAGKTSAPAAQLVRDLTLTSTTALVIGSIIGTGVFFKAAIMSQQVGSPALVLAAWLVAGLLSLAGALTYAELGAML